MLHRLLIALLLLSTILPAQAFAAPKAADLMDVPSGPVAEKPVARDVLDFHPYSWQSAGDLVDAVARVDWWVEHTVRELDPETAKAELLALQFDLLQDWLLEVPRDGAYLKEVRDASFTPEVTPTEKVLMAWDLQVADRQNWRMLRDRSLDAFRLGKPEEISVAYRGFCGEGSCAATPDQVQFFVRQVAALRAAQSGWADALMLEYELAATDLLTKYPTFAAIGTIDGRSSQLEEFYGSPRVASLVGPLGAMLEILSAMGPEGYAAIERYRSAAGDNSFLPFPEKLTLQGGGHGYDLLVAMADAESIDATRRQALLGVAMNHAMRAPYDTLDWPRNLLSGQAPLFGYHADTVALLKAVAIGSVTVADTAPVGNTISIDDSGVIVINPELLTRAAVLRNLPADEAVTLLESGDLAQQQLGLTALAMNLEDSNGLTQDDWYAVERDYLRVIQPFLSPETDPGLRGLALAVLQRLAPSTAPVDGALDHGITQVIDVVQGSWRDLDVSPVLRQLTLRWHARSLDIRRLTALTPLAISYGETLDPSTLGLGSALGLIRFHFDVMNLGDEGLSPVALRGIATAALDRMTLFHDFEHIETVAIAYEAMILEGTPLGPADRAAIEAAVTAIEARADATYLGTASYLASLLD